METLELSQEQNTDTLSDAVTPSASASESETDAELLNNTDVSSGDALVTQEAANPYVAASSGVSGQLAEAAVYEYDDESLELIYEELQLVNDNLNSLAAIHQEGYGMQAIFIGLIAGMLLMLGLWLGGHR